jgi:hypothetical protein
MTASQLPGGTLQPIPIGTGGGEDDKLSLLQKCVENSCSLATGGMHADFNDDEYMLMYKLVYNLNFIS